MLEAFYKSQIRGIDCRVLVQQPVHLLARLDAASRQVFLFSEDFLDDVGFSFAGYGEDGEASVVDEWECHCDALWRWLWGVRDASDETVCDVQQPVPREQAGSVAVGSNAEKQQVERWNSGRHVEVFTNCRFVVFSDLLQGIVHIDADELLFSQRHLGNEVCLVKAKTSSRVNDDGANQKEVLPKGRFGVVLRHVAFVAEVDLPLRPVGVDVRQRLAQVFAQRTP